MTDAVADSNAAQSPKDFGPSPSGVVSRWVTELDLAGNAEKDWRKEADKIVKRYRSEGKIALDDKGTKRDTLNILYSNVQTLGPICYNSTPEPVVVRRPGFDKDPVAKQAGEILRRAIKFVVSSQDFDEVMTLAVQDYLLPGRASVSVKYVPLMGDVDQGGDDGDGSPLSSSASIPQNVNEAAPGANPSTAAITEGSSEDAEGTEARSQDVVDEEIRFDLTRWTGFRRGPGHTWQDVPWIAYELEMSKADCVELFGDKIGNDIPLQRPEKDEDAGKSASLKEQLFARAKVWQIWDKDSRKVLYICPEYKAGPCRTDGDLYNLSGFYNCPRPLYAVETSDSLVPVPEFAAYQSLADEAEELTNRAAALARMIRVRLAYPAAYATEFEKMTSASEGDNIPIANADEWMELGGIEKMLFWWPVEKIVEVYSSVCAQRDRCVTGIWEVLGVADIQRGASEAQETATAQGIKDKWGSLRTKRRQSEVQRFVRDLFRIAGELIATKFNPQTLQMMTGAELPTEADLQQQCAKVQQDAKAQAMQQAQAAIQKAQQGGPPVDPAQAGQALQQGMQAVQQQCQQIMAGPSWEKVCALLKDNAHRAFRIDIETDSTIALQNSEDQTDFAQMMAGIVQLFTSLTPAVQGGFLPFEAAKGIIMSLVRKFRLGSEVEDAIEAMVAPAKPDPTQDPKVLAATAVAKINSDADAQSDKLRAMADIAVKLASEKMEQQTELANQQAQTKYNVMQAAIEALPGIIIQHLKNVGAITVAEIGAGSDVGMTVLDQEMTAAHEHSLIDHNTLATGLTQPGAPLGPPPAMIPGNGGMPQ